VIKFENITKIFGDDFIAVDNINIELSEGKIYGFLGPNGAGKTTTLKMLTGVLSPNEGSISINGYDIEKQPIEAKNQFAFVSDDPDMFLKLRGIEFLKLIGKIYKIEELELKQNIFKYADLFEMSDSLNDKIESYSHGMRQKINIIGALIHNPKIWILDEPLTGLDPKASFTLKNMMREHADNGNIVLFSTHVLEVAEKVCDHVFIINKGKVIFDGKMNELKANKDESLEKIFLELVSNE
jgi:ABC-2 type transport system ATP-binding protein